MKVCLVLEPFDLTTKVYLVKNQCGFCSTVTVHTKRLVRSIH